MGYCQIPSCPSTLPSGSFLDNGKYYLVVTTERKYTDAIADCSSEGMQIAEWRNLADFNAVLGIAGKLNYHADFTCNNRWKVLEHNNGNGSQGRKKRH